MCSMYSSASASGLLHSTAPSSTTHKTLLQSNPIQSQHPTPFPLPQLRSLNLEIQTNQPRRGGGGAEQKTAFGLVLLGGQGCRCPRYKVPDGAVLGAVHRAMYTYVHRRRLTHNSSPSVSSSRMRLTRASCLCLYMRLCASRKRQYLLQRCYSDATAILLGTPPARATHGACHVHVLDTPDPGDPGVPVACPEQLSSWMENPRKASSTLKEARPGSEKKAFDSMDRLSRCALPTDHGPHAWQPGKLPQACTDSDSCPQHSLAAARTIPA
ncbi:hypothetical protein GGI42DRAFT_56036 [Trichoderma sp. SZMC 28013]